MSRARALVMLSHLSRSFSSPSQIEESGVQHDKEIRQDFLDETDITMDPIIHQSPFNIKARNSIPALARILDKRKLEKEPCNVVYSVKIIHLLHRWFAYIPLWSCVMTDFFERYANDETPVSTTILDFWHGRVSNASIESYFRTIKLSVLQRQTSLRPHEFLTKTHLHILSRMKDDRFSVTQSSRGRRKNRNKADDLNVKEVWKRRGQSNTKNNRRGAYFRDEVSETVACKMSDPDSDEDINYTDPEFIDYVPVSSPPRNMIDVNDFDLEVMRPPSPPTHFNPSSIETPASSANIFLALSDANAREDHSCRTFASKRSRPSSDSSCSISIEQTSNEFVQKEVNCALSNVINTRIFQSNKDYQTTIIGDLELTWPAYGIEDATYAGRKYFIFHTCAIDTGLFILYYAYKAHSDEFRNLLATDTHNAYTILHRTFQLVDREGWTTARLFWATQNNLLTNKCSYSAYDLMNTMEAVVFQFVKPMQTFTVKSVCACVACPKQVRDYTSTEISLTKAGREFMSFIPNFMTARQHPCRMDLGRIKPRRYPAQYSFDEKFPVVDIETNVTRIEKHYICEATRVLEKAKFLHRPPFVIVDVGKDPASMIDLPNPLYIGEYTYHLSAGIDNTKAHFTAIIKSHNNVYYHYDDTHPKGCVIHNGHMVIELALYVLQL